MKDRDPWVKFVRLGLGWILYWGAADAGYWRKYWVEIRRPR